MNDEFFEPEEGLSLAVLADSRLALSMPTANGYVTALMTLEQAIEFRADFDECVFISQKVRKSGGHVFSVGGGGTA